MEVLIVRTFGMKASQVCTSLCAVVKFIAFVSLATLSKKGLHTDTSGLRMKYGC